MRAGYGLMSWSQCSISDVNIFYDAIKMLTGVEISWRTP